MTCPKLLQSYFGVADSSTLQFPSLLSLVLFYLLHVFLRVSVIFKSLEKALVIFIFTLITTQAWGYKYVRRVGRRKMEMKERTNILNLLHTKYSSKLQENRDQILFLKVLCGWQILCLNTFVCCSSKNSCKFLLCYTCPDLLWPTWLMGATELVNLAMMLYMLWFRIYSSP